MATILLKPSPSVSSFSTSYPVIKAKTLVPISNSFRLKAKLRPLTVQHAVRCFSSDKQLSLLPQNSTSSKTHVPQQSLSQLSYFIKPFILSQYKLILSGWLCSIVSVYSVSKTVSKLGQISGMINKVDPINLRHEGLVFGALVFGRLISCYGQQAFLWEAALNAAYELRVHVFGKVLARDLGFFEGMHGVSPGDIAYRITAEASDVADTVYAVLNTIVPSTLQLTAMATQMFVISPVLSCLSALVIPCVVLVTGYLGNRLQQISKEAQCSIATLSSYLNEVLPAILFVKATNAELCELIRFKRLSRNDLSACIRKKKMKALAPQIIQAVFLGALFTLFIGSLMLSSNPVDGFSMVSFVTLLIFIISPIQDVGKTYNEVRQGQPSVERLLDLTSFSSKIVEKEDAISLDHVTGELKFCDVSFKYGDDKPLILKGLNLHVKPGETVALVGPSGGGKTTLVKLLLRLYDPSSGCILIDNHNIQDLQLSSLRRHVGLVLQDITLFSGTVAENLGYRDLTTKIDMDRVKQSAQMANADEFVMELPDGYATNIGPGGSILSGGQKQRLAIARALYQDSSILILDEATSSLDSRSELLVRQAVGRLMKNRTVLVIAHRLETVSMANRIFQLANGKLSELTCSALLDSQHDDSSLSSGFVI